MLVSYIIKDFKDTPAGYYNLLRFEIILILLYNYLPNTLISRVATDGLKLLDQTTYLNNEIDIANSEDLKANIKTQNAYSYLYEQPYTEETSLTANQNYSKILKNYSISMWIFVNAHNTSTASYSNETTIFAVQKRTTNPVSNPK
jgi:hypothetical protein